MYWCLECGNYRKYGNKDWWNCTQANHKMHNADEKFKTEIKKTQKLVDKSNKSGMTNSDALDRLGVLMAIKQSTADPKVPAKRAAMILQEHVKKYSKTANNDGRVFFWIQRNDGSYDAFSHDDENLTRFLLREYYTMYGDPLPRTAATQAIDTHTATGDIPSNIIHHTGKRIIKVGDVIWIDLHDDENSIYKVTPDHCGPSHPYSPDMGILFDRGGGSEMPMPKRREGDWLNWFAEMLRIPKERRMLFRIHVCHMFCMWQETPFMMFSGPERSGKSVTAVMVKELIDPVGMNSAFNTLPTKDENKLAMMLTKEQTQLFDNISYISPQISDMLCQACTGGKHTTRELYTSNNMLVYPFHKMRILLTGISKTTIRAPDLASRILHYDVPPGQTDKSKNDLEREYRENRPYILYTVLNTISKAMKEYKARKDHYSSLQTKTRMTDFERFGSAIAHVLGDKDYSSIRLYQDIMQESMSMMVADEPLIRLIEKVLDDSPDGKYFELTATFFAHIRELGEADESMDSKGKEFPKSIRVLKSQIDRLKGALLEREIKITVEKLHDRTAKKRQHSHITIEQLPPKLNLDQSDSPNSDPTNDPSDNVQPAVTSSVDVKSGYVHNYVQTEDG